jgi:DNA-binding NtrC family response regulator
VRLVSATNADLPARVGEGSFREDLLFRLNTVEIQLPPLRDRKADIALLADHFLCLAAKRFGKSVARFDAAAMQKLLQHAWPGNVRELDHVVQRAVLMAKGDAVMVSDLGLELREASPRLDEMSLEDVERHLIKKTLERCGGNVTEAANELGLSRSAMYRRVQKHGL